MRDASSGNAVASGAVGPRSGTKARPVDQPSPVGPSSAPYAIEIRGVTVRRHGRDGVPVLLLDDVSWSVGPAEHWVVLGPNGAGKSTLLQLAAANLQPSEGRVSVLGERIGGTDLRDLRERIGHVDAATARALRPGLDGLGVVLTGAFGSIALQRRRLDPAHLARAGELLDLVRASPLRDRRYDDCSQGERQRLLLARALMGGPDGPELLLLDEPATGLDLPSRERLLGALVASARRSHELPTVTVTHHMEEIPAITTHALLLRDGRVLARGLVDDVLTSGPVSACFGIDVDVERSGGRWTARVPEV
jgi:iron complex transport system ATP-binding protein